MDKYIPKLNNNSQTMLLTVYNEKGPVMFYSEEGIPIGSARPQGESIKSGESEINVLDIIAIVNIILDTI